MPIKSWSFTHSGHPIRVEIWWRFSGWSRRRLYIDHKKAVGKRGWFHFRRPLVGEINTPGGGKQKLTFHFRSRWIGFDKDCRFATDADRFAPLPSARIYKQLQYHPERGEEIDNKIAHKIGCLFIFAFLLIMCVIYAPVMIGGSAIYAIKEKHRRIRMRKLGRCLTWPQIEKRMQSMQSPSTLIVQWANLSPTRRFWWTQDDLPAKCPLPLPHELVVRDPSFRRSRHPLTEWCHFKYFDEKAGTAFLADLDGWDRQRLRLLDDNDNPARLHKIFPQLNVVVVGLTSGERAKAAPRFAELLGDDFKSAIPNLIAGITDDDKAIRELSLETIRLAGISAESAIPALNTELYLAPHDEGLSIAETLGALGPSGVEVLEEASKCGDPSIRQVAKSALSMLGRKAQLPVPKRERPAPPTPAQQDEADRKRRREFRRTIAIVLLFLAAVATSAWFFGTWLTLTGAAVVLITVVGVSFWILVRRIRKRTANYKPADA